MSIAEPVFVAMSVYTGVMNIVEYNSVFATLARRVSEQGLAPSDALQRDRSVRLQAGGGFGSAGYVLTLPGRELAYRKFRREYRL